MKDEIEVRYFNPRNVFRTGKDGRKLKVPSMELLARTSEENRDNGDTQEEDLPTISGYAAVTEVETVIETWYGEFKEKIQKGAFARAIREKQDVRALFNHDANKLLGRTTSKTLRLKEDATGLYVEIDIPDTSCGKDTAESIRRGDITGQSFAFVIRKQQWIMGENGESEMRIIQDLDLYDVGPVTYPAYQTTDIGIDSASRSHEKGLRSLGKVPIKRNFRAETVDIEPKLAEIDENEAETAETVETPVETAPVEEKLEAEASLAVEESQEQPAEVQPVEVSPEVNIDRANFSRLLELGRAKAKKNEVAKKLLTE